MLFADFFNDLTCYCDFYQLNEKEACKNNSPNTIRLRHKQSSLPLSRTVCRRTLFINHFNQNPSCLNQNLGHISLFDINIPINISCNRKPHVRHYCRQRHIQNSNQTTADTANLFIATGRIVLRHSHQNPL